MEDLHVSRCGDTHVGCWVALILPNIISKIIGMIGWSFPDVIAGQKTLTMYRDTKRMDELLWSCENRDFCGILQSPQWDIIVGRLVRHQELTDNCWGGDSVR